MRVLQFLVGCLCVQPIACEHCCNVHGGLTLTPTLMSPSGVITTHHEQHHVEQGKRLGPLVHRASKWRGTHNTPATRL